MTERRELLEGTKETIFIPDEGSWISFYSKYNCASAQTWFIKGPLSEWREGAKRHASVRVGASSLNAHYFQWALDKNYTMPSNTIRKCLIKQME